MTAVFSNRGCGYLDRIECIDGEVIIEGWCLEITDMGKQLPSGVLIMEESTFLGETKIGKPREDVVEAFGLDNSLLCCGFEYRLSENILRQEAINCIAVYGILADKSLYSIEGPYGRLCPEHIADLCKRERERERENIENIENIEKNLTISSLRGIGLSLTTRCNLRCIYCKVHSEFYIPEDMDEKLESILEDCKSLGVREYNLGIMGEPTIFPEFINTAKKILDTKSIITIATNCAKLFSNEEIDVLSNFDTLEVSLDTFDINKLKKIRLKVDGRNALYNIIKIKSMAILHGKKIPKITLSVVVNEDVAGDLPMLAAICSAAGISQCQLLDMRPFKRKNTDLYIPKTIHEATDKQAVKKELKNAIELFEKLHVAVSIDDSIAEYLDMQQKEQKIVPSNSITKACLAPWTRLYIAPNGHVSPCCMFSSIGQISTRTTLKDLVNSSALRRLRRELLTGRLNAGCAACCRAKNCSTDTLKRMLASYSPELERAETFGQPISIRLDS